RLLIVPTLPYGIEDVETIIRIRAKTEGLDVDAPTLKKFAEKGMATSLRHALQLLTPAAMLAKVKGRDNKVQLEDLEECEDLFVDFRKSRDIVESNKANYLE